ncbi:MAG: hypothetical protein NTX29_09070 [Actinobacteria bacterium]|nr:hypothetical protein [Actinomycetota bacterium]
MTGDEVRRPWWYSGDDGAEPAVGEAPAPAPATESTAGASMDWSSLMAGAQRMVDWATEKVMAPHADHADPAAHPECMVCRTLLLVGESGPAPSGAPDAPATSAEPIRWIPIRG